MEITKSSNIGQKNIRDIARASAGEQARARTMNRERKNTLRNVTRVPTRVRYDNDAKSIGLQ